MSPVYLESLHKIEIQLFFFVDDLRSARFPLDMQIIVSRFIVDHYEDISSPNPSAIYFYKQDVWKDVFL